MEIDKSKYTRQLADINLQAVTRISTTNRLPDFKKIAKKLDIVHVRTCQRWFSKFHSGELSIQESDRSGRTSKIDNDALRSMLENNPHLTNQEIAEEFGIQL
ncbi:histone-lysine N-methyltransferase SETMAR [Trichonephila clavipes]|nr:histone-lysine N-methyltransferase SETMAR [Trichonephila clavipes]